MGRKSRKKRERRLERMLREMRRVHKQVAGKMGQENPFHRRLVELQSLFRQYKRPDVAIALSVSELWPPNTGSPIKHIFAWCVLLDLACDPQEGMSITSYIDFKVFAEALYATWPEFAMLEDFSPEADWGQIKVRLAQDFVPMFYGSCIERTPDFVEAFRITYAHIPEAQAHMDLAIALQARIIDSMADLRTAVLTTEQAHVEVPTEDFWLICTAALQQIGTDISHWRAKAGRTLETHFDTFNAQLTLDIFEDAVMQGEALPFLAVEGDGAWVPMSVRSAPDIVINHWAKRNFTGVSPQAHLKLAQFVAERFRYTCMGPLTLFVGDTAYEDHPISCIISANSSVYFIFACNHTSIEQLSTAVTDVFAKVKSGTPIHFRLADGRKIMLSKGDTAPNADDLRIVIVPTQARTVVSFFDTPLSPARLLPLADFITIFDNLTDLNELERYWKFVDTQKHSLSPFSRGAADLFASFKDTHGVLVEGAKKPDILILDPHWGTSWRFKVLTDFWLHAPKFFPDNSVGWWLSPHAEGVVKLQSRNRIAVAYSTSVGSCTVQTLIEISEGLQMHDARLLDLFAQLLTNCTYRCRELMSDIPLFHQSHVLFFCVPDLSNSVDIIEAPLPIDNFAHVVTVETTNINRQGIFHLRVNARAVLAGLNMAKDGSFEVRCLLEALNKCHAACGLEPPDGFEKKFYSRAEEPARYHLEVADRHVDVPDYVEPVVPSSTDYKLARKHLAEDIMRLGLAPGRYELSEAKSKVDLASTLLRLHIENRLASLNKSQLLQAFIEQHDALLIAERIKIQRTRQSLAHAVEYDRLDTVEEARKEFGAVARHYRYLLEKVFSSQTTGKGDVTEDVLRELVGLVDWYMVLTGASDILHNGIDVGGVDIDDSYIPDIFYSTDFKDRETEFIQEYARSKLGFGINNNDVVEGELNKLLSSKDLKQAFLADLGFDLQNLLTSLAVLSQAQRYGFGDELSLSYSATPIRVAQGLATNIETLDLAEAENIVQFLTLSEAGVRRLAGKDADEGDVPYWERNKRIHRYTIRPLVVDGTELRWGAETASRSLNIWMAAVRDGDLPAEFGWPHVSPIIRKIKEGIEKRLELRTEEIFKRYTPFVRCGVDFFRQFRKERFEDVGDFDVFAYWPDKNLIVTAECKYNLPPFTVKDGRRLRDRIFGNAEDDRKGQFSRIQRRRQFLEKNRSRLLELLDFPKSEAPLRNEDLYVCRDLSYWMFNPPYPVATKFVRVATLDSWIKTELILS